MVLGNPCCTANFFAATWRPQFLRALHPRDLWHLLQIDFMRIHFPDGDDERQSLMAAILQTRWPCAARSRYREPTYDEIIELLIEQIKGVGA